MPHRVALIPGDGIGPEVTAAARRVIDATGVDIVWDVHELGMPAYEREGEALPPAAVDAIRSAGAALKGPVATPVGGPFRSVSIALREELDLHTGIRPARSADGGLDVVVVRMTGEDLYAGIELPARSDGARRVVSEVAAATGRLIAPDAAIALKPITRAASERTAHAAFTFARANGRSRVTAVHKATVMPQTDGLFLEAVRDVSRSYRDIELDDRLVDAAAADLAARPERLDVIVTTMLYGDVLSDLAAALAGGLGLAPGENVGPACAVFEAVHGTAERLAGRDVANPAAMILCGALMLRHLGEREAAERVEGAVRAVVAAGESVTYDLTPSRDEEHAASTTAMTDAVIERL